LNSVVAQSVHTEGRIAVTLDEKLVPAQQYSSKEIRPRVNPAALQRLLDQGASLIVNEIDDLVPSVGDLAQTVEWELGANTWINAYVTFARGGAFRTHYDSHDVIALQLSGSKQWSLFGNEITPVAPTEVKETAVLNPGDVLFVPRGFWHRANVLESPSVHLTIGINGLTGGDFLRWGINSISAEPLFRRYLPRVGGEAAIEFCTQQMKARLHEWVDRLSPITFLNDSDNQRRARPRSVLLGDRTIQSNTVLRLALRRIPIRYLESLESSAFSGGDVTLGGDLHNLSALAVKVLIAFCKTPVIKFETLAKQIRHAHGSVREVRAATIELMNCGLINKWEI
jgi:uncharacterized RmlC-like cupin family protein